MSVETNCLVNLWFGTSHSFQDEATCKERLDEYDDTIERCKERLHRLTLMTEPGKFCPKDRDIGSWLDDQYSSTIEALEEAIYWKALTGEVYRGMKYMLCDDKRTARKGPESFEKAQRIEGDYIPVEGEEENDNDAFDQEAQCEKSDPYTYEQN